MSNPTYGGNNPDYTSQSGSAYKANIDTLSVGLHVGSLGNPLLWLPMNNSLAFARGVGSVLFARADSSPSGVDATYKDLYGVLQYAGINVERVARRLLVEGPSINICTHSKEFDHGDWADFGGAPVINPNDTAAPDGSDTADEFVDDDGGTWEGRINSINFDPAGGPVTISIFCKDNGAGGMRMRMRMRNGSSPSDGSVTFNFITETVGALGDASVATNGAEYWGNGWWRIWCTLIDNNSGTTVVDIAPYVGAAGADTGAVWYWGAQMEELSIPSSYIPTVAAEVTRAADIPVLTIAGNIPLQADAMTVLADVSLLGLMNDGTNQNAFKADGETARSLEAAFAGDRPIYRHGNGNVGDGVPLTPGVTYRLGGRFDGADGSLWQDGVQTGNFTPGDVSDALGTSISIGHAGGTHFLYGYISNLRIYDYALNDREMALA